jgi:hypothetical protein
LSGRSGLRKLRVVRDSAWDFPVLGLASFVEEVCVSYFPIFSYIGATGSINGDTIPSVEAATAKVSRIDEHIASRTEFRHERIFRRKIPVRSFRRKALCCREVS